MIHRGEISLGFEVGQNVAPGILDALRECKAHGMVGSGLFSDEVYSFKHATFRGQTIS